jgi:multidrug efflux system outer membrane protein
VDERDELPAGARTDRHGVVDARFVATEACRRAGNAARVDTAEARRAQAEIQYRMTVTTAFREVRDALVLYETTQERVEAVERQVEAIDETRRIAEVRYDEGLTSFIELLDAQRALLDAELALAEAKRDRLSATATLFKAMGGGWSEA